MNTRKLVLLPLVLVPLTLTACGGSHSSTSTSTSTSYSTTVSTPTENPSVFRGPGGNTTSYPSETPSETSSVSPKTTPSSTSTSEPTRSVTPLSTPSVTPTVVASSKEPTLLTLPKANYASPVMPAVDGWSTLQDVSTGQEPGGQWVSGLTPKGAVVSLQALAPTQAAPLLAPQAAYRSKYTKGATATGVGYAFTYKTPQEAKNVYEWYVKQLQASPKTVEGLQVGAASPFIRDHRAEGVTEVGAVHGTTFTLISLPDPTEAYMGSSGDALLTKLMG